MGVAQMVVARLADMCLCGLMPWPQQMVFQ